MQLAVQLFALLCGVLVIALVQGQGAYPPRLNIPGAVATPVRSHPQQQQVVRVRRPVALRQQNSLLTSVTPRILDEPKPVTEAEEDEQPEPFLPSLLREQQLAQAQQSQFQQAAAAFLNGQPGVLQEAPTPVQHLLQHEDTQPTAILPAPPRFAERPAAPINRPAFNDFGIGRFESTQRLGLDRTTPLRQPLPEPTVVASPPPQRVAVIRTRPSQVHRAEPIPSSAAPPRPRPKPIQPRPLIDQNQLQDERSEHQQQQQRRQRPVAQTIRKWREENEDGSITWGYENDDGSFKEEIIGTDCVTKGTYGYIDPDGNKREYHYETGIKCDPNNRNNEEELQENGFINYEENRAVLPNGLEIDMSQLGKKKSKRPNSIYRNN